MEWFRFNANSGIVTTLSFNEARERSEPFCSWFSKEKKPLPNGSDTRVGCLALGFSVPVCMCVIQHCFGSRLTTALDAHITNSSPGGHCARTHTKYTFSCWCGGKLFTVGRARYGNVGTHMSVLGKCSTYKIVTFLCLPTPCRVCLSTGCRPCLSKSRQTVPVHSRHIAPVHSSPRQEDLVHSRQNRVPGSYTTCI